MFTTFTLLIAAGACSRLAIGYGMKRRYGVSLHIQGPLAMPRTNRGSAPSAFS
jgi:hypothetical protein